MKRLVLTLGLVSSLVFANSNVCNKRDVNKIVKKSSKIIGEQTVKGFIKVGEKGAVIVCQGGYQLGCNAASDAETVIIGGVAICGTTGITVVKKLVM